MNFGRILCRRHELNGGSVSRGGVSWERGRDKTNLEVDEEIKVSLPQHLSPSTAPSNIGQCELVHRRQFAATKNGIMDAR